MSTQDQLQKIINDINDYKARIEELISEGKVENQKEIDRLNKVIQNLEYDIKDLVK